MAKISEVGHAKNVANFNILVTFAEGYGAAFNPSKAQLKMPALKTAFDAAEAALDMVIQRNVSFNKAVNERSIAFGNIKVFATRVFSALRATDATAQLIEDAQGALRKIRGQRAVKLVVTDPAAEPSKSHSISQLSFDLMIQHTATLFAIVSSEASYDPTEADLTVAALSNRLADLVAKNQQVASAYTDVSNARIERDKLLYQPLSGLVDIAASVKSYVKSLFGNKAAEYKQISGINFRRIFK